MESPFKRPNQPGKRKFKRTLRECRQTVDVNKQENKAKIEMIFFPLFSCALLTYPIKFCFSLECEHLIRHMLVRDVAKRYTMVQIMNHKWVNEMDEEDKASALIIDSIPDAELSDEVLTMMLSRGIDREKTIQVLLFILKIKFLHF